MITWKRLTVGLRRPMAVACLLVLGTLVIAAVLAKWIAPDDPYQQDLSNVLSGPSAAHWLGTDELGRDILSRLIYGARLSLFAGLLCIAVAVLLGVTAGVLAGFFAGRVMILFDRVTDLLLATPVIMILLTVLAVFGPNMNAAMIALGVMLSADFMRLSRGSTLEARSALYVDAAQVFGLSRTRILLRHIVPNVLGPVIVRASTLFGAALFIEAGLSFIGLGARPPTPTWGSMVAAAGNAIYKQPWYLVPTGGIIVLTVLASNLFGDTLLDATVDGAARARPRRWSRLKKQRQATVVSATAVKTPAGNAKSDETLRAPAAVFERDARQAGEGEGPKTGLLSVSGLEVSFPSADGWRPVVTDVGFEVPHRGSLGIVGESGSGKTITMLALLGLVPSPGKVTAGKIFFNGRELDPSRPSSFNVVRGSEIGFVAQEPMVSLDPVFTVGAQLAEPMRHRGRMSSRAAHGRVLELLDLVGMPDPRRAAASYPHELSGGMAQRVAIALALGLEPKLLVADEPTTALDVTVQADILDLFRSLQEQLSMSMVIVTHDFGVLADSCDSALVMYAGEVVEQGPVDEVLSAPAMPYTAGLLRSNPYSAVALGRLPVITGSVPDPGAWPSGCRFQARCAVATPECAEGSIPLTTVTSHRRARCVRVTEAVRS
ncbi:dipeptide/oligopeptide/nickel ABC transporter permease/ATP-binding protein [Dactylosporangium sp. NPDC051484]|uniref:dipeptide/oligopeptide/nickel ABC transporter permease/ATP-binding protein n=1 Tax=Dactylosporangium sp. NPDC051484 TaxID=3154942 RepID=UPI00344C9583